MGETKHTECMDDGTWVCDYCHNLWDKAYHPDFCDEYCPDYMESGKFCGTEAQWAKARLIASAPALLEALEALQLDLENNGEVYVTDYARLAVIKDALALAKSEPIKGGE